MSRCWTWRGKTKNGYPWAGERYLHREVCKAVHGAPPLGSKSHATHACGNKACLNPWHLRWGTAATNMQDTIRHYAAGTGSGGSRKLTWSQVLLARALYALGMRIEPLAEAAHITRRSMFDCVKHRTYQWVGGPSR